MHSPDPLPEAFIGAAFQVSNTLGADFLEKARENASEHGAAPLRPHRDPAAPHPGPRPRHGAGGYLADLLVEGCALVEVKTLRGLQEVHLAQCLNHLAAADLRTCLPLNFGRPRLEIRRVSLGCPGP